MNDDMNQGGMGDQNPASDTPMGGEDQPMGGMDQPAGGEAPHMPEVPAEEPAMGPDMGTPTAEPDMGGESPAPETPAEAPVGGMPEEHHDDSGGQV